MGRKIGSRVGGIREVKGFDPKNFSTIQVAKCFGVNPSTITSRWLHANFPQKDTNKYDMKECIEWYADRKVEKAVKYDSAAPKDLKELRQVEKLEIQIRQMKKELVAIDEVQRVMNEQAVALKEYFTNAFTTNIFVLMGNLGIPPEKEEVFKEEWAEFIKQMVNTFVKKGDTSQLELDMGSDLEIEQEQ